jgi:ribosomal protein S12 methylthiotransferase
MPPVQLRRVALISLGCAKNLADSEDLVTTLRGAGFQLTRELAAADLVLVNTCSFVADARDESVEHIQAAVAGRRPGARVIVAGCLASRAPAGLVEGFPGVDAWLPAGEYRRLPALLRRLFPGTAVRRPGLAARSQLTPPHYAYLKVAEGCSKGCNFCAIPLIRGPHRSRPLADLVRQARLYRRRGVREIILISQHLDDYGCDLTGGVRLPALIGALAAAAPESWIRLHYCYPDGLTDAAVDAIAAHANVVHYLDLPIQHASDRMLALMGRRTTGDAIRRRLAALRSALPDVVLRTSLLVGHPGETEDDVEILLDFLREQRFDLAGCFRYSEEEGTVSALWRWPGHPAPAPADPRP